MTAHIAAAFALEPAADGELLVRLAERPDANDALVALNLYAYGATRESPAGRARLEGAPFMPSDLILWEPPRWLGCPVAPDTGTRDRRHRGVGSGRGASAESTP